MREEQMPKEINEVDVDALIKKYDEESNFRDLRKPLKYFITISCVILSLFHIYTAGFGLLDEISHRSVHMAFIMGLLFLVFPARRIRRPKLNWVLSLGYAGVYVLFAWQLQTALAGQLTPSLSILIYAITGLLALSALPVPLFGNDNKPGWLDWPLAVLGAGFSAYLVIFFNEIFIVNVGYPQTMDYLVGSLAMVLVIEGTRRTMGESLSVIAIIAIAYAMLGPYLPGALSHRGYDVTRLVGHLYLGTEGIYGIALGVVSTYVFHFVLFGVLAQASGLGTLFIELATVLAGRYVGGPAKVSIVSSGFFGMISGSSIANTVTTGAFTIPLMQRYGFSGRFAAATEAASSCGGQVTPPIMGAAAFVMSEMLGIPYNELILIAIIPAAFHYFAAISMVHLESKRLNLKGMPKEEIPKVRDILARHWHQTIPLIVMVSLLFMQFTPFLAAFWGIVLTIVCSYIPVLVKPFGFVRLDDTGILTPKRLVVGLEEGAKQSISITAACACVGFLLGITTLTGLGFKFSGVIVSMATDFGTTFASLVPFGLLGAESAILFFALILVAIACILMGAGIPTTPTYIILSAIVAPALGDFGIALLASHFFIFYYGVVADVTPPVALAAYAGSGIAGSNPMQTGITAFRLSMGKALVPFMFIYAPSLLFLEFNAVEFVVALASGMLCITALSAAYIGYFNAPLNRTEKTLLTIGGLALIGNLYWLIILAAILVGVILFRNHQQGKRNMAIA